MPFQAFKTEIKKNVGNRGKRREEVKALSSR